MAYDAALDIQCTLQKKRIEGVICDTFLSVEHPPVLTMGKRGQQNNVLATQSALDAAGIKTVWINRGGDVTYHGPGQLVGYPIMHLAHSKLGIKMYVSGIQQTIINYLKKEFSIIATKKSGVHTGVWVDDKKICAIGVSVSHNVTLHGFAFNINTNLSHFDYINPCGLGYGMVTSLKQIIGRTIDFQDAKTKVVASFCDVFGVIANNVDINALMGDI